jgi:endonuclease YncB( thermonuclease family)
MVALVDLGVDSLFKRTRIRLDGVDTPDAFKSGKDTEAGKVREQIRELVMGRPCSIDIKSMGKGGWKVVLMVKQPNQEDHTNVNQLLIEQGYVFKRQQREVPAS